MTAAACFMWPPSLFLFKILRGVVGIHIKTFRFTVALFLYIRLRIRSDIISYLSQNTSLFLSYYCAGIVKKPYAFPCKNGEERHFISMSTSLRHEINDTFVIEVYRRFKPQICINIWRPKAWPRVHCRIGRVDLRDQAAFDPSLLP